MTSSTPLDVHAYYRQITDVDIGVIARDLLGSRITQESGRNLFCDCPNHRSQSHRSLHVFLDKQGWYCFGCGVGGDVLQLVEFVLHGAITKGQSGLMPDSHRDARDFLAGRVGLPPMSKAISGSPVEAEESHGHTWRVREALTALADHYHSRLVDNAEVLTWFRSKYGIGDETIARLKIGFAISDEPSVARALMDGPEAFTMRELVATSAFRPTNQDGIIPFFDRRIVFPYWGRGHVVFMIGRRTPWTPDHEWEKSKYKKLAVRNDSNNSHIARCIRNDVLYNEDVFLTRPDRIIITEGVTDCISLMEHGFPAVSPVTVQIREADWERLLAKLAGVKTVYICQDNEVSEAGLHGALRTAGILSGSGILTRVATLPLGRQQQEARQQLREKYGVGAGVTPKELATLMEGRDQAEIVEAEALLAGAKIDVNEFFSSGKTAADFEAILAAAQTPLEMAIARLSAETPDSKLSRLLDPILAEISRLDPIEQDRHFRLIQDRIGKARAPVATLRRQMKVVRIDRKNGGKTSGRTNGKSHSGPAAAHAIDSVHASGNWRDDLLLNLNGTVKPILANAVAVLRGAQEWAGVLAWDEFGIRSVAARPAPWMASDIELPHLWSDTDDSLAAAWMQRQGVTVPTSIAGEAIEVVARERNFHPVREYLKGLTWDGQPRLWSWLTTYLGVDPSPYASAVGTSWMVSAVARIFVPGVKADNCLILEGPQGIKKSSALRALAQPWFTDEIADLGSKDAALQTQGAWVIEIAELDGMSRSDVGRIKAFMSRQTDRFRPPYGQRIIESGRQCVFAGSVNHSTYLRDETGGRRFWPVECRAPAIDVDGITEIRDQLWAEAATLYFDGKPWWLDSRELTMAAALEQADRYEGDPWDELIANWSEVRDTVSISEVLEFCLEKRRDQWTQHDKNRISRSLRSIGWERFNAGSRHAREWRYRRRQESN